MKKSFIVYPKTKISILDRTIEKVDAPIKVKLKSYITGYLQDYDELPSIRNIQSVFGISELDADMALSLYSS